MDIKVEWSPAAVEDLEAIAEYIARDSVFYAGSVVSRILAISRGLGQVPFSGRVVPEIDDANLRERLVFSYRLIYRVDTHRVVVVAVLHGKRLIDSVSQRFQ